MILNKRRVYIASAWQHGIDINKLRGLPEDFNVNRIIDLPFLKERKKREYLDKNFLLNKIAEQESKTDEYELLCLGDENYPKQFFKLENPPACLYLKGNVELLTGKSIGIVGSRKLRHSVLEWAEIHLSSFLEKYPVSVVSGAAHGVDQLGHRLALRKKVPTIAFLPSGFDRLYPLSFKKISQQILDQGGLLVSEYPPDFEVKKYSFHARNRLIAAFSKLVFVLQAERKSGSLITANQARFMGTDLAALPGNPIDPVFFGSNDLIAEGAVMIRDRDDLASLYYRKIQGEFEF